MTGVSHNSIYRGKNLGTISTLNEYIAFRTAHGIDDKSYKDLYLGDYFKINDGTYNKTWMVAHFDYFYRKGRVAEEITEGLRGVLLISIELFPHYTMNTTNSTEGGYKASLAYTTHCPAIASAVQTVLGSYLLKMPTYISTGINSNIASMAGGGMMGASTSGIWVQPYCILPSETQVFGDSICASSYLDNVAAYKMQVFDFVSHVEHSKTSFWLRSVCDSAKFCIAYSSGNAEFSGASNDYGLRPLIYIG